MDTKEYQNLDSEWLELLSFLGNDYSSKSNGFNTSRPVLALSPEMNLFIEDIIRQFKSKEGTARPEELASALTAATLIFPYSYTLRTYVEAFCQKYPNVTSDSLQSLGNRGANLNSSSYRIALAEILAEIENHHAKLISTAKYHGMEIWPMLRSALATDVENKILAQGRLTTRIAGDAETTLYRYENAFTNEVKYTPPDISFLENSSEFKGGKLDVEFLFFSRALRYIKRKNGYWVDGPCDYLHQLLAPNYSCLKIEEYDDKALKRQPRVLTPSYFRTPWNHDQKKFFDRMKSEIQPWHRTEEKESWRLYTRACSKLGLSSDKKRYNALLNNMKYASGYASFFKDLIGRINPKFVFQEFYYSPESIGLIMACKSLGVPVIEVQHGLIGSHQWQTTHWLKMPERSYINHPDYYWVFDKFEKQNSEAHQPRQALHRPAIVAGHAELEIYRRAREEEQSKLKPAHKTFLKELGEGTYNVLFSPQYHHVDFTGIVAVSRALPKDARLLVRLHPMQLPIVDGITELIEKYGTDNIEVEYSTKAPLYCLMEKCHHVITKYSTLAREGLEFDMDVTLLDDMGRQLFHQYVDLGRMAYCGSNESLIDKILDGYRSFKDPIAWETKLKEFKAFREENLNETPESAVEELRRDWESKKAYRAVVAKACEDLPVISVPLNIEKCAEERYIKDIERSSGDFGTRRTFLVDEALPLNRNVLARLFTKTVLDSDSKTAIDIVFHGTEADKNAMEILTLFSGMPHRPVNVHLDVLGSIKTATRSENDMVLGERDIEALPLDEATVLKISKSQVLSPSNDIITQSKRWLESNGLRENVVTFTFSDDLTETEVVGVLFSNQFKEIAQERNVLVNGSRHFESGLISSFEDIRLFEPGVYTFDAAVALCSMSSVNILISNNGWERLFVDGSAVCIHMTPNDWKNANPTAITHRISGEKSLPLEEA